MEVEKITRFQSSPTVIGIDFSGAKDAGRKIWLTTGNVTDAGLDITQCVRARDLPGGALTRISALAAVVTFIASQANCVVGIDAPFGLSKSEGVDSTWNEFVRQFPTCYQTPEQMRADAWLLGGNREVKRLTDSIAKTPFAPSNLRLYRQTFYAIRDVLGPLVKSGSVVIPQMQRMGSVHSMIIEICPAATLKRLEMSMPYKKPNAACAAARRTILSGISGEARLQVPPDLAEIICRDHHGDALDSVIAAAITFEAWQRSFAISDDHPQYQIEGYVYH